MSGTSCDGVDAALVRVDGYGAAMRATHLAMASVDYPDADRRRLAAVRRGTLAVGELAGIGHLVAGHYVRAVRELLRQTRTAAGDVTAVAAHGQTLFHSPPVTYQAFDPARLACETGIDVVSDFRRADCAVGGQGAPLVPFGDWVLFRSSETRVLLNLGGIANVTILPGDSALEDVQGYDIGPANCLSDWLMRDAGGVDAGGEIAGRGTAMDDVVEAVLADEFFDRPPPKSTDTPAMIGLFERALSRRPGASLEDKLATANAVVAAAVGRAIGSSSGDVFVAGGGVHNADLMRRIGRSINGPLRSTADLGVPTQAREAVAFALLGAAYLDRLPCYMPRVTGATRAVVLGALAVGGRSSD